MRGTLAQEAVQAMQDARDADKEEAQQQPSDADKVRGYQAATAAVMDAASKGAASVTLEYPNFALLRYVGQALTDQGINVAFDFARCSLTAKWG